VQVILSIGLGIEKYDVQICRGGCTRSVVGFEIAAIDVASARVVHLPGGGRLSKLINVGHHSSAGIVVGEADFIVVGVQGLRRKDPIRYYRYLALQWNVIAQMLQAIRRSDFECSDFRSLKRVWA
jgi:hypothetical protein